MARPDGDDPDLREARALFDAFRWRACVDRLTDAEPLDGAGLLLLGQAVQLIGDDEAATTAFARAYQRFLADDDPGSAARSAMWAALVLENAVEPVRSAAWAARALHLVETADLGGGAAAWALSYRAHTA